MIINLVVITKGAGRVSEVSARFTLDALPASRWRSTPTSMPD
jgi:flagellar biosynthesis component FlhA